MAAHRQRESAAALDSREAVFVGSVVAQKDRPAAGEGLDSHEGGHSAGLRMAQIAQFEDHLAAEQAKTGTMMFDQPGQRMGQQGAGGRP